MLQEKLPAAFIDLEAFDRNIAKARQLFRGKKQTLRLATKSLRVPGLIWRALDSGMPFQGLMCYSAEEALFLASRGFNDFLIAYPTLQKSDLAAIKELHDQEKKVSLIIDSVLHLQALERIFSNTSTPFPVLIDVDMSLRVLGGAVHLGVRRSPIRTVKDVAQLISEIEKYKCLSFSG
ncbi:MAG: alanine racemase, partial [Bdellovibrionota bacterium]